MNRIAKRRPRLGPPPDGAESARVGVVIHATARFEGRWWRVRQHSELRGDGHLTALVAEHPAARPVHCETGMPMPESLEEV